MACHATEVTMPMHCAMPQANNLILTPFESKIDIACFKLLTKVKLYIKKSSLKNIKEGAMACYIDNAIPHCSMPQAHSLRLTTITSNIY